MKLRKVYIKENRVDDYGHLPVADVKAQTKGYKPDFNQDDLKFGCVCFDRKGSHFFYLVTCATKKELEQLGYKGEQK